MTPEHPFYKLIRECLEPGSTELSSPDPNVNGIDSIVWNEVYAEMQAHAIDAMPQKWLETHHLPDEALRQKWLRSCMRAKARWIKIMHGQSKLLQLLESEKIDCVIIKGAAAAMAYPQPMLRRCGDIDFLVRQADFERAAQVLENNGYELAEEKYPTVHHYKYSKNGIIYELHRRLGSIRKDNHELISLFEEGITHRETAQIEDFSFPVLPLLLNGLVLLFHINQHLRSGLGMRHMLDWMTYLNENDNLQQLLPILKKTGMEKLALTVTAACQKYLGLRKIVEDPEQYPIDELMDYILKKGNFGNKAGEEGRIATVFMATANPVELFQRLQIGGHHRWKAAKKYRFLRPFAWIYQIGFILNELAVNRITPAKMVDQKKTGDSQRELIRKLGLDIDREI